MCTCILCDGTGRVIWASQSGGGVIPRALKTGDNSQEYAECPRCGGSGTETQNATEPTAADKLRWRAMAESSAGAVLQRLIANYQTDRNDIEDSDLDNEQPINIKFRGTLGDIRTARRALQCYAAIAQAEGK